jgi:hypothetical protein
MRIQELQAAHKHITLSHLLPNSCAKVCVSTALSYFLMSREQAIMGSQYKRAAIVNYECGDAPHTVCCLEFLAISDKGFAKQLNRSDRLQRVFALMTCSRESEICSDTNGILDDEAGAIAMEQYIEHALQNRARFATTQKFVLKNCYRYIQYEPAKQYAERMVNAELEYVAQLLHHSDNAELKHSKEVVAHWLAMDVSHDQDDGHRNNDGGRDLDANGNVWQDEDDRGPPWIPME